MHSVGDSHHFGSNLGVHQELADVVAGGGRIGGTVRPMGPMGDMRAMGDMGDMGRVTPFIKLGWHL